MRFVQIFATTVAVQSVNPGMKVLPGAMAMLEVKVINQIFALDEEGHCWQYDSDERGWKPLTHVFQTPSQDKASDLN